ncbi:hypothetical protein FNF29_07762 [Cafeteria roenbergensis]|uniref:Tyrosine-protein kinase ephrin type A/B receptor-like domain-containing protein n=1 Tax=Cafeteria roenbergensis TaxID=33653 RepID=A0A5A8C4S4_CAFRO|nr:hypothetical protein FNF29_07762 [Cafeteria roenbergensis]|eukprot:KAA0146881.1 hypothetical protein FNF29_07762 [Cafeteria roenbergensis]
MRTSAVAALAVLLAVTSQAATNRTACSLRQLLPGQDTALLGLLAQSNRDDSPLLRAAFNWSSSLSRCCWTGVDCGGPANQSVVTALNISTLIGFQEERMRLNANWFFCDLANMTSLDISGAAFVGIMQLPQCIRQLQSLHHLDLTAAGLSYLDTFETVMATLPPSIRSLSVGENRLLRGELSDAANVPFPPHMHSISVADTSVVVTFGRWFTDRNWTVVSTYLADTAGLTPARLPPTITWFTFGSRNYVLSGFSTGATGAIPAAWCEATELEVLVIRNVGLGGQLPDCIGKWTKMRVLDLTFTFMGGNVPPSASNLLALEQISLADNLFFDVSPILAVLSERPNQLRTLELDRNPLGYQGTATAVCTAGPYGVLNVASTGPPPVARETPWRLPDEAFRQRNLAILSVAHCGIQGTLRRDSFQGLPSAKLIILEGNAFSGEMPDFTGLENLTAFMSTGNPLTNTAGLCSNSLGADFQWATTGRLASDRVARVQIGSSAVCGEFPSGLMRSVLMQGADVLDASNNDFVGNLSLDLPMNTTLPVTRINFGGLPGLRGRLDDQGGALDNVDNIVLTEAQLDGEMPGHPYSLDLQHSNLVVDIASALKIRDDSVSRSWLVRDAPTRGEFPASSFFTQRFTSFVHHPSGTVSAAESNEGALTHELPVIRVDPTWRAIVAEFCKPPATDCSIPPILLFNTTLSGAGFLQELRMSNVRIVGDYQSFLNGLCLFTRLSALDLPSVGLEGDFPPCLANLRAMATINLSGNRLANIPAQWSSTLTPAAAVFGLYTDDVRPRKSDFSGVKFENAVTLNLGNTAIVRDVNDVMKVCVRMPSLVELDLHDNAGITGALGDGFFEFHEEVGDESAASPSVVNAYVSDTVAARIGGPTAVGDTFQSAAAARSALPSVYMAMSKGFITLQRLDLSGCGISKTLPRRLPSGVKEMNFSRTSVEGEIHRAFAALDVLDARACPLLRGPPLPPFGADATLALPAVLRPFWTDQAVRERLGDCCGLSDFMAPAVSPVYETVPGAAPEGFDGEVECRAVYSPANPGLQLFITPEYDNWARARCKKGSFGFGRWCSRCPTGSTTASAGAQTIDECECEAGEEIRALATASAGAVPSSGQGCAACPVGTFRPAGGGSSCSQCPGNATTAEAGSVSDRDCECEAGFEPEFATNATLGRRVLVGCRPCAPMWTKADRGNGLCRPCAAGWYSLSHGSVSCEQCAPDGVLCPGDGTLSFLPGMWAPSTSFLREPALVNGTLVTESPSGPFVACPNPKACLPHPGRGEHMCAPEYAGPACSACALGTTRQSWGVCVRCEDAAVVAPLIALLLVTLGLTALAALINQGARALDRRAAAGRLFLEFLLSLSVLANFLWYFPSGLHEALFIADAPAIMQLMGTPMACIASIEDRAFRRAAGVLFPIAAFAAFALVIAPCIILCRVRLRSGRPLFQDGQLTSLGDGHACCVCERVDSVVGGERSRSGGPCCGCSASAAREEPTPSSIELRTINPVSRGGASRTESEGSASVSMPHEVEGGFDEASFRPPQRSVLTCGHERSCWLFSRPSIRLFWLAYVVPASLVLRISLMAWGMQQLQCASLGDEIEPVTMADPTVPCSSFDVVKGVALAVLVFAGLIPPLLLARHLVGLKRDGKLGSETAQLAFGFFEHLYLWQSLVMLRQGMVVFALTAATMQLQTVLLFCIYIVFLMLLVATLPFVEQQLNILAVWSLLAEVGTLAFPWLWLASQAGGFPRLSAPPPNVDIISRLFLGLPVFQGEGLDALQAIFAVWVWGVLLALVSTVLMCAKSEAVAAARRAEAAKARAMARTNDQDTEDAQATSHMARHPAALALPPRS